MYVLQMLGSQWSQPGLLTQFHFYRPVSSVRTVLYVLSNFFFTTCSRQFSLFTYNRNMSVSVLSDGLGQTYTTTKTEQFYHLSQVTSSPFIHSSHPSTFNPRQPLICFVLLYIRYEITQYVFYLCKSYLTVIVSVRSIHVAA